MRNFAKAEFLNPGGSVKDRSAYIIQEAEEKGLFKPGGTVVEGTFGNTGIGLAHICNARLQMPDCHSETQSQEKIDALKTLGADARVVPAVACQHLCNNCVFADWRRKWRMLSGRTD